MSEDKRKVLILDERSDSLMDLFELVYREGFETTGVSSEEEALSCVAQRKPDVLIDHLRDSETTESPFLERLRNLSPRTRIILLSNQDSDSMIQGEDLPKGTIQWISGPFQASKLIDALNNGVRVIPAKAIRQEVIPTSSRRPVPALA